MINERVRESRCRCPTVSAAGGAAVSIFVVTTAARSRGASGAGRGLTIGIAVLATFSIRRVSTGSATSAVSCGYRSKIRSTGNMARGRSVPIARLEVVGAAESRREWELKRKRDVERVGAVPKKQRENPWT